ncbi:MBOAT family O-acyltransferase [Paenibacillus sp. YYML68]|uniref:MBOAT family O-acyltransferase n=1 Tax=Paenibacillus sp. YYML68 TaxID=2909250 RepID=UPI00248FD8F9|nr:MBOAT family O-acyltransferase [Paenibacillus sp. YYML68]
MVLFSWSYIAYLVAASLVCMVVPEKFRKLTALLAGIVFAVVFLPHALPFLILLLVVNLGFGRMLDSSILSKSYVLAAGIASNILLLGLQQSTLLHGWVAELLPTAEAAGSVSTMSLTVLHVGSVFLTLQAISYLMELYRGRLSRGPGAAFNLAHYLFFFPKLLAGPIEKPQAMMEPPRVERLLDRKRLKEGLLLMGWGIFQKLVIADRLAVISHAALDDPQGSLGWGLIIGTVCFALQLYFDLCAYTDMSVGAAHLMGYRLGHHFQLPWKADRPFLYWERWMCSLRSWVEDYMEQPLRWLIQRRFIRSHGDRIEREQLVRSIAVPVLCTGLLLASGSWGFLLLGVVWLVSTVSRRSPAALRTRQLQVPFASRWLVWLSACLASVWLAFPGVDRVVPYVTLISRRLDDFSGQRIVSSLGVSWTDFNLALVALLVAALTGYGKLGLHDRYPYPYQLLHAAHVPRWKRWVAGYVMLLLALVMGVYKTTPFLFGF